jgi:Pentapeptide repeats (8 copies)
MSNKYIAKMTGYKATNADMTCTPWPGVKFQFELGKWYEHEGEISLCGAGFHFCVYPSGPYAFYSGSESRIFKIEAEQVLDVPPEAGADFKLVAKRIRLVEEITPGYRGTDKPNDGDLNTGDGNTGDLNTGNRNTGDLNTGNRNTGNRNTGNRNTGDGNTGNRNTGDLNTGDGNTGNGNTTDRSSGFFCAEQPKVLSFDVQTDLTYSEFLEKFPQACQLGKKLMEEEKICFDAFKMIPGITKAKLEKLHAAHLARRKKS